MAARCRAFGFARKQDLLCELEDIIHRNRQRPTEPGVNWNDLVMVVGSPLAADFSGGDMRLRSHWDEEARTQATRGRHPLNLL